MRRVSRGSYKDQEAVILESAEARAVVLPQWGAKLASLVHAGMGIETLWQTEGGAYRRTQYADNYGKGEISGFDEMFPTISRCLYEQPPLSGTEAPDHGEVWTLPWEHSLSADSVRLWVHGVRFPYRLEKEMSLDGARLVSRYRASNLSRFPLDFIWAAHPLFNVSEGMEFIVPRGMDKVLNAVPGSVLADYGEELSFPLARPRRGRELRLDRVPKKNPTGWQKYWFRDRVPEGWCMMHDPRTTLTVGMAWPKERVPYLGMWLNEGGWENQYNIAPEPATAAMDRIDLSKLWGMGSTLAAGETREWHLVVSLATGKRPAGMKPDGTFISS
jgi:galactose mutarotase-like enzyme